MSAVVRNEKGGRDADLSCLRAATATCKAQFQRAVETQLPLRPHLVMEAPKASTMPIRITADRMAACILWLLEDECKPALRCTALRPACSGRDFERAEPWITIL